uniref:Uncharacterized protein n=1 Tax=Rhizophora mucronata TaxID=61149 RepID=A0A2P2NPY4_RHIMU
MFVIIPFLNSHMVFWLKYNMV